MRRRDDGFRSVMEFMIASACLTFQEDGRGFVSLSGAPLARSEQSGEELDRTDRLLDKLGASLEPFYGFRSLHAFKAKFAPRYEPHPPRLPRRGGPAPHRRGSHQGLPARRDPSPAARRRALGSRRAGRRGCAVNGSEAQQAGRTGSCRVVPRRLRCDQHDEGDAHLGRPARFNSWVLHHTIEPEPMADISVIDGPVPVVVLIVGAIALVILLARRGRAALVTVAIAARSPS